MNRRDGAVVTFDNELDYTFLLSTWYPTSIVFSDRVYPTVQHFVTSVRFPCDKELLQLEHTALRDWLMFQTSMERPGWNNIRELFMICGLLLRNQSSQLIRDSMLQNSNFINTNQDEYWGSGVNNNGMNMLGVCMRDVHDIAISNISERTQMTEEKVIRECMRFLSIVTVPDCITPKGRKIRVNQTPLTNRTISFSVKDEKQTSKAATKPIFPSTKTHTVKRDKTMSSKSYDLTSRYEREIADQAEQESYLSFKKKTGLHKQPPRQESTSNIHHHVSVQSYKDPDPEYTKETSEYDTEDAYKGFSSGPSIPRSLRTATEFEHSGRSALLLPLPPKTMTAIKSKSTLELPPSSQDQSKKPVAKLEVYSKPSPEHSALRGESSQFGLSTQLNIPVDTESKWVESIYQTPIYDYDFTSTPQLFYPPIFLGAVDYSKYYQ